MSQVSGVWLDPRVKFWTEEARWYRSSSEWVFLAQAVQLVGELLFTEQWTGTEPSIPWHGHIPADPFKASESDLNYAQRLLLLHHGGYRDRAIAGALLFMPIPTLEEWAQAHLLSVEQVALAEPPFDRFISVAGTLITLFESGVLPTGTREVEGGQIFPLHRAYWNGESVISRFRCCRIHPADPFTWATAEKDGLLIFVRREELESYCSRRTALGVPSVGEHQEQLTIPLANQSQFLKVVNQVAAAINIDPDNPPKDADLKDQLRSAWPADLIALTPSMLTTMARVMRSIKAQNGGAKRQRKPAQSQKG